MWGILAKVLDGAFKFFTVPMLVGLYGKADYGLIALAFSLNAYLRLMDMGINIGSIRFFSVWISNKEWTKISAASRSSILFYGGIGLINTIIFIVMAQNATAIFDIQPDQEELFRWILYILAASTVFNWTSSVIVQLLSANGQLSWVNRAILITSGANFISAVIAVYFHLSLPVYFVLYTLSTLITIPINLIKLRHFEIGLKKLLLPSWNGEVMKEIMGYGLAIFAMGIFQFSANNLRPLLLTNYASDGIEVLTDYRVLQTITTLIMAIGGIFNQVLLPSTSRMYAENDQAGIAKTVYEGTKYITIVLSFIVFLIIINADKILGIYMGPEYVQLTPWLIIWLLTVLVSLHIAPVASLVLSGGKTRPLVFSSATACILSIPVTIVFADSLNVGAAVIGFFAYILMQIGFYYVYYTPRILKLNGRRIFWKSFMPATMTGIVACGLTFVLRNLIPAISGLVDIIILSVIFSILYITFTVGFILRPVEIKLLYSKIVK